MSRYGSRRIKIDAFTLFELLIVIFILSLSFFSITRFQREGNCLEQEKALFSGITNAITLARNLALVNQQLIGLSIESNKSSLTTSIEAYNGLTCSGNGNLIRSVTIPHNTNADVFGSQTIGLCFTPSGHHETSEHLTFETIETCSNYDYRIKTTEGFDIATISIKQRDGVWRTLE